MLVVKLPNMDKFYGKPTQLKETNHKIYMDLYKTLWEFIGFKPSLTKEYKIQDVISEESLDDIERWIDSFYSFIYELDKKVVEEIRKDERIEEEAIQYSSDSITNSFLKINTHDDLKKLIKNLKSSDETININLTEKYFTGKGSSDIFLVVQLKKTRNGLEVKIINYKLVLSAIGKTK